MKSLVPVLALMYVLLMSSSFSVSAKEAFKKKQAKVISMPKSCDISSPGGECFFKVQSQGVNVKLADGRIYFAEDSFFKREGSQSMTLFEGLFYVESSSKQEIDTLFGVLTVAGKSLIKVTKDKVEVSPVKGFVVMEPIGHEELLLKVGMSNWMSAVGFSGKSEVGIPLASPLKTVIKRWSYFYKNDKASFMKDLEVYRNSWVSEISQSSHRLKSMVLSRIERKKASIRARERRRKQLLNQRLHIEEMYKQRNHY